MLTQKNEAIATRALVAQERARILAERRAADDRCKRAEQRSVEGR
jgi:hypothetical protein